MNKLNINASMLFKIRQGDMVVLLSRHTSDEDVFYNKQHLGSSYSGGMMSLVQMRDDLTHSWWKKSGYDIIAIKQYDSQSQALCQLLSKIEPEWDWVREENIKEKEISNFISKLEQQLQEAKNELEIIEAK